jgi:hypothetical protein
MACPDIMIRGGMMKRIMIALAIFAILAPLCNAIDHVVITEVLYDPVNTESGGEAVEIYNPTNGSVDISGWVLRTESSASDATIPSGTVLLPEQYYLIADSNWETMRDDLSWDEADHTEPITLMNSDSGVALVDSGVVIDAVGWGDPLGIPDDLYETVPAAMVSPGKSLLRDGDSDNNVLDFSESEPGMKNSTMVFDDSNSIILEVSVENNAPTVESVVISPDDDGFAAGVQVIPEPGSVKTVTITADVADADGANTIQSVLVYVKDEGVDMVKTSTLSNTTAVYSADISMQYYDAGGLYNVTVTASDSGGNSSAMSVFEYYEMIAIELDTSGLQFPKSGPGSALEMHGDYAMSTADAPSVRNIGNVMIDVGIEGSDMTDGGNSIGVDNLMYTFDNDFGSSLSGVLSAVMQTVVYGMEVGENAVVPLGFRLEIPSDTPTGNYSGSVTVVASGS